MVINIVVNPGLNARTLKSTLEESHAIANEQPAGIMRNAVCFAHTSF
jgi:hypothetical protein